ncbi:MAG: thioredoxin family protein [Archaeoglobales archaeon]|nr:thioredoxin family protein [Archaeoglobales archaeon]
MQSKEKYLLVGVIVFALVALAVFGNYSDFDRSRWKSYEEGLILAEQSGKEVFIFVSSKTCPTCSEFKRYFTNEVMRKLEERYVPVFLEYPKDSLDMLPKKVTSFPTFCVGHVGNISCREISSIRELMDMLEVEYWPKV